MLKVKIRPFQVRSVGRELLYPKISYRRSIHPHGLLGGHRESWSYIPLPHPFPHPLFEDQINRWCREAGWPTLEDMTDPDQIQSSPHSVKSLGETLKERNVRHRGLPLWIEDIPVLPWIYRMPSPNAGDDLGHHLNLSYHLIYHFVHRYREYLQRSSPEETRDYLYESAALYRELRSLLVEGGIYHRREIPSILSILLSKEGLPRYYSLAYHIDNSGRAVIVPSLEIAPDEVLLPYRVAKSVFWPLILIESRKRKTSITPALVREVVEGRWVILNRQPTLHRGSMMSFRAKVWEDESIPVIGIHPSIVEPFNADFDGDTMAVWPVFSRQALADAERMTPAHNLRSPLSGAFYIYPRQDYLYALYHLTKDPPKEVESLAHPGSVELLASWALEDPALPIQTPEGIQSVGRLLVQEVIGGRIKVQEPLDKKGMQKLLFELQKEASPEELLEIIDRLHDLHPYASMRIDLESLLRYSRGEKEGNPMVEIVQSGARAKEEQLRYMAVSRGNVRTPWGIFQIESPFMRGLSPLEFFAYAFQARSSLVDKGITISRPGYLARRVMLAMAHQRVVSEDCGDGGMVWPETIVREMPEAFYGLWNASRGKFISDAGDLSIGDRIRSPLSCKVPRGVCRVCAGLKRDGSAWALGDYIGAEVTGYLTEPTTQMTLRVFHTGGGSVLERPYLSPWEGEISEVEGRKVYLQTPEGERGVLLPPGYALLVSPGQRVREGQPLAHKPSAGEIQESITLLEALLEMRAGMGIVYPEPYGYEISDGKMILTFGGERVSIRLPEEFSEPLPLQGELGASQFLVRDAFHPKVSKILLSRFGPEVFGQYWAYMVRWAYLQSDIKVPFSYISLLYRSLLRDGRPKPLKQAMKNPPDQDLMVRLASEDVRRSLIRYLEDAEIHLLSAIAMGLHLTDGGENPQ